MFPELEFGCNVGSLQCLYLLFQLVESLLTYPAHHQTQRHERMYGPPPHLFAYPLVIGRQRSVCMWIVCIVYRLVEAYQVALETILHV